MNRFHAGDLHKKLRGQREKTLFFPEMGAEKLCVFLIDRHRSFGYNFNMYWDGANTAHSMRNMERRTSEDEKH